MYVFVSYIPQVDVWNTIFLGLGRGASWRRSISDFHPEAYSFCNAVQKILLG